MIDRPTGSQGAQYTHHTFVWLREQCCLGFTTRRTETKATLTQTMPKTHFARTAAPVFGDASFNFWAMSRNLEDCLRAKKDMQPKLAECHVNLVSGQSPKVKQLKGYPLPKKIAKARRLSDVTVAVHCCRKA
eukprot:5192156-Amphidinium_carterae.2